MSNSDNYDESAHGPAYWIGVMAAVVAFILVTSSSALAETLWVPDPTDVRDGQVMYNPVHPIPFGEGPRTLAGVRAEIAMYGGSIAGDESPTPSQAQAAPSQTEEQVRSQIRFQLFFCNSWPPYDRWQYHGRYVSYYGPRDSLCPSGYYPYRGPIDDSMVVIHIGRRW